MSDPREKPKLALTTIKKQPPTIFPDLINGTDLDAMIFPELEYAIPGIIPEGSTLLVGPPKAGKSWLVLGLALAVASGNPALSSIPIDQPRPVLMLALEDGRRRFQSRCRTILGPGTSLPPLLEVTTKIDPKSLFPDIERWLYEHQEGKPLVVLDTLGKVMPPNNSGESAYQRDYRIGSDIKRLTDNYPGSSFVSIHHDRKAESADFVDAVSGTHGLAGAADTIILLERDRQSDQGVLKVTGRDVNEAEYAIVSDGGRWRLNGTSLEEASIQSVVSNAKLNVGDISQQIIDFLYEHGPTKIGVLKENFGEQCKVNISRLVTKHRIIKCGYAEYSIPNTRALEIG